jgi:hypothetical protein
VDTQKKEFLEPTIIYFIFFIIIGCGQNDKIESLNLYSNTHSRLDIFFDELELKFTSKIISGIDIDKRDEIASYIGQYSHINNCYYQFTCADIEGCSYFIKIENFQINCESRVLIEKIVLLSKINKLLGE